MEGLPESHKRQQRGRSTRVQEGEFFRYCFLATLVAAEGWEARVSSIVSDEGVKRYCTVLRLVSAYSSHETERRRREKEEKELMRK